MLHLITPDAFGASPLGSREEVSGSPCSSRLPAKEYDSFLALVSAKHCLEESIWYNHCSHREMHLQET